MRRLRTEPSPKSVCQSLVSVFDRSSLRVSVAAATPVARSTPNRLLRMSWTAARDTLSPMTSTVTVAPLTMSTCGGRSAPEATRPMSLSMSAFIEATTFSSGMPISTIGSLWSTNLKPRITPLGSMPTTMWIGLPE